MKISKIIILSTCLMLALSACSNSETEDQPEAEASANTDSVNNMSEDSDDLRENSGSPTIQITKPADKSLVPSPVEFEFNIENIELAAHGQAKDGEGHLHLIIDKPCVNPGLEIPDDDSHIHLADGSKTAKLDLEPGEYTICAQIGDGLKTAVNVTDEISITVE